MATVSKKGAITAKKPGKTTITCKGKNGKKYTCKVSVTCLHSQNKLVDEKKASCMEAGYTGDTYCDICNKMIKKGQAVASGEHNYQEKYTYFEATCNRPGIVACVCVNCGAGMYKETEKSQNHIYDYMTGTYTDGGYATKCTMCGSEFMVPCPHGDLTKKGYVEAGCGVDGYTGDYYCAYCDLLMLKGEVVAGYEHSWELWDQVSATCTNDGYDHYICNLCGVGIDLITETKTGHTEKQTTVSANCIDKGYIKKYCGQCGTDLGATELPALGHKYYIGEDGWVYCEREGTVININLLSVFGSEYLTSQVEIPPETLLSIVKVCPVDVSYNECLEQIYPKVRIISSNTDVLEVNDLTTIKAKKHGKAEISIYFDELLYKKYDVTVGYDLKTAVLQYIKGDADALVGYDEQHKQIIQEVANVITTRITEDMSDYQKVQAIYQWYMDETTYMSWGNNALCNIFLYHCGECDDFTLTFALFMDILEIECYCIGGDIYEYNEDGTVGRNLDVGHAWNAIYIDAENGKNRQWYYVDVTWTELETNKTVGFINQMDGIGFYFGEYTARHATSSFKITNADYFYYNMVGRQEFDMIHQKE